jgi:hypothetical protein
MAIAPRDLPGYAVFRHEYVRDPSVVLGVPNVVDAYRAQGGAAAFGSSYISWVQSEVLLVQLPIQALRLLAQIRARLSGPESVALLLGTDIPGSDIPTSATSIRVNAPRAVAAGNTAFCATATFMHHNYPESSEICAVAVGPVVQTLGIMVGPNSTFPDSRVDLLLRLLAARMRTHLH